MQGIYLYECYLFLDHGSGSQSTTWQHSSDLHHALSTSSGILADIKGHNKENEDVGFMSSDSSSSSSSDE